METTLNRLQLEKSRLELVNVELKKRLQKDLLNEVTRVLEDLYKNEFKIKSYTDMIKILETDLNAKKDFILELSNNLVNWHISKSTCKVTNLQNLRNMEGTQEVLNLLKSI